MLEPPIPEDEAERLAELWSLAILDTPPETRFDRITRIAQQLFQVQIALVSLVDENRQWFKSCQGLSVRETPRNISFCGHAILGREIFCVQDTHCDPRFADNPLVTGPPRIRFYAGAPLTVNGAQRIGTLCIIDSRPRDFSAKEREFLRHMADWVQDELGMVRLGEATAIVQEHKSRLSAIVNNIVDGIVTLDPSGIIETINPMGAEIFAYPANELVGKEFGHLLPEPYRTEYRRYLSEYLQSGEPQILGQRREVVCLRSDGSAFPAEVAVSEIPLTKPNRSIFVAVVRDITERRRIEKLKSEFVAMVSHELRTPLTSIRGSLGLIAGGAVGEISARAGEMLHIAIKNSDRLIQLINDILDIEKFELGKLRMKMARHSALVLVKQSIEANEAYAREFGVGIELLTPNVDAEIDVDNGRFIQVMTNLLSNAIKVSPNGEKVRVSLELAAQALHVSVADAGPGIPEEFRDQIFERFSQLDASTTRRKGGTGLGLAICKAIVEQFGGQIDFHSKLGIGTSFFFTLPLA